MRTRLQTVYLKLSFFRLGKLTPCVVLHCVNPWRFKGKKMLGPQEIVGLGQSFTDCITCNRETLLFSKIQIGI